ncbi:uncharacterized protein Z518_05239 [Rhinocladiella mackenziei CBS 650.93]|uniref:hydroxymethylglutaryl-CoA lyase n=1 Tax=Rhinocladiella mackenziei CBS 650.93 TaxID=1442369 RepID=A0A0D2IMJ7_9EURO|nr:uncharacterized protein Z518_05239 [Rhinocladiella mackenziei CBS 650.93]KIX04371.1 hypothetical protein Z518_05239 [Rhinocladiella mackenziei CBS 650.93]
MNQTHKLMDAVRIVEVGPRDGLQNIRTTVPTQTKLELISRLRKTGLKTIEITSVVSPRAIPQLADCRKVLGDSDIQTLLRHGDGDGVDGLHLPVLIPNLQGLQIALESGVREVAVFVSASEGFSRANINATVDQGLSRARHVAQKATTAGLAVRGYVSCIFADPYDGPTPPTAVLKVVRELFDMGCYQVSLGDTLGVGTAVDVKNLCEYLRQEGINLSRIAGHFHDTYGQAVCNVWQAYLCGIRVFDASVGGLGGCPFAPGAKGNAATEDLVYFFQQAGVQTGVDLLKLVEVGIWISDQLGKITESRAGAALAVKHGISISSNAAPCPGPAPAPLSWTLTAEMQGLKIYRSGVNLKIVLNRPKNGNALTASMITELTQILDQARNDSTINRIVIAGEGKFFCTGMDLGNGTSPVAQSKEVSDAQYQRLTRLFDAIDRAPQVTMAAINGPAFGGGVGLSFACDIRIAVHTATMTLSEVKLGLCPATISKYVIREWGVPFAREAMLSARPISTAELKRLGLIARVVEHPKQQLSEEVDLYLSSLKVAGPEASRMCKEIVKLAWVHPGSDTQANGIKDLFDRMMRPDGEAAIGLQAFQAQRRALDWDQISQCRSAGRAKL